MNPREEAKILEELGGSLLKHVYSLGVAYESMGELRQVVYSGFVIQEGAFWFWITAGHCLHQINELRTTEGVHVHSYRLHEALKSRPSESIPIEYDSVTRFLSEGLSPDIGSLLLPNYVVDLLRANTDMEPFSGAHLRSIHGERCAQYFVLGYPAEIRKEEILVEPNNIRMKFRSPTVMLSTSLDLAYDQEAEPTDFWGREDCLYGQVDLQTSDSGVELTDISGMSGGPVIGFDLVGGAPKYWICGLQSMWLPKRGIVRVETTGIIIGFLEYCVSNAIREIEEEV